MRTEMTRLCNQINRLSIRANRAKTEAEAKAIRTQILYLRAKVEALP